MADRVLGCILGLGFFGSWLFTRELGDPFTTVKWAAVYAVACLGMVVISFGSISIFVPHLPRAIWILVFSFFTATAYQYVHSKGFTFSKTLVDRSVCACIFVVFVSYFHNSRYGLNVIAAFASVAAWSLTLVCLFQDHGLTLPFLEFMRRGGYAGSFGNTNMMGEFLGASVFFQIFTLSLLKKAWLQRAGEVLLALSLCHIFLLVNRSAWLGLILGLAAFIFNRDLLPQRRLLRVLTLSIAFMALAFRPVIEWPSINKEIPASTKTSPGFSDDKPPVNSPININKVSSTTERWNIWGTAISMISDKPWGIGPGLFEYGILPYQVARKENGPLTTEALTFRSPHNDFLLFAAENGLHSLLLALALCGYFITKFAITKPIHDYQIRIKAVVTGLMIYYFIELLFQFPLDNALSAYTIVMIAALTVSCAHKMEALNNHRQSSRALAFALAFGMAWISYRYLWSNHLTFQSQKSLASSETACDLDPYNLRACTDKAYWQIAFRNFDAARETLRDVLTKQKFMFPAVKLAGHLNLIRGEQDKGCFALHLYDRWFWRISSVHKLYVKSCSDYIVDKPEAIDYELSAIL